MHADKGLIPWGSIRRMEQPGIWAGKSASIAYLATYFLEVRPQFIRRVKYPEILYHFVCRIK